MIWIVISTVLVTSALADPCDQETFDLPTHTPWNEGNPPRQTGIVFDLEGARSLLLKLDCGEYHLRMRQVQEQQLAGEVKKNSLLEETLVLYERKQKILEDENARLYEKWKVENKKRHTAESKAGSGWLGWATAAILATTTVSFGAAFALK